MWSPLPLAPHHVNLLTFSLRLCYLILDNHCFLLSTVNSLVIPHRPPFPCWATLLPKCLCLALTLIILWITATVVPHTHFFLFLTGLWFLKPVYRSCSVLPLHVDCLTEIQPIHPELSILLRKEMKRKSRKWQHGGQLYWSTWWFYNS